MSLGDIVLIAIGGALAFIGLCAVVGCTLIWVALKFGDKMLNVGDKLSKRKG